MSRAFLKAEEKDIAAFIKVWAEDRNLHLKEIKPAAKAQPINIHAANRRYLIHWHIKDLGNRIEVEMSARLRMYLSVILNIAFIGTLSLITWKIAVITQNYMPTTLGHVILLILLFILIFMYKHHFLWLKLTIFEKQFWLQVQQKYDTELTIRYSGYVEPPVLRLAIELTIAIVGIVICGLVGGIFWFFISTFVFLPFCIVVLVYLYKNNHPQWHWHFWIIGNMSRWIFVMLCVLIFGIMLCTMEVIIPLHLYNSDAPVSMVDIFRDAHFRTIPAESGVLESDSATYIVELAEFSTKDEPASFNFYLRGNSILQLIILCLGVLFFTYIPLKGILSSRKTWQHERIESKISETPVVPYLTKTWHLGIPVKLRMFIVFHFIFGGIINIAAAAFSADSINYIIFGRCFIVPRIANLWSWVFAPAKLAFGNNYGRIIGSVLILIVCMPFLTTVVAFLRRIVGHLVLMIKIISTGNQQSNNGLFVYKDIGQLCKKFNINLPFLILSCKETAFIKLHYLPLINKPVIEISKGAIDLLKSDELKAAIAHEVGHIKQGMWKVNLLKVMSCLAFFPNYYLMLCMNWSAMEIEADRFSVEATKDKKSLKNALIKTSASQFSNITYRSQISIKEHGRFQNYLNAKLNSMLVSVKFFYGDRLLGYVHPNLSERLDAIEKNYIK